MNYKPYLSDWNKKFRMRPIEIEDDTLRDGLQGALLKKVSLKDKIKLLKYIVNIGVEHIVVGFPATSQRSYKECESILFFLKSYSPKVKIWCLSRLDIEDIKKIELLKQSTGVSLGVCLFAPTSRAHQKIKNINLKALVLKIETTLSFLNQSKLIFSFNFEDCTRSHVSDLVKIANSVLKYNPYSLALCDTAGASHPSGVREIVRTFKKILNDNHSKSKLLWHGHNDKGLALANAVQAIESGVDIVSGSFFGYGERSGNVANEQVAYYLNEAFGKKYDLKSLNKMSIFMQMKTQGQLSHNFPLVGKQVFSTSAGVHSSAMIKSARVSKKLFEKIYCDVDVNSVSDHHKMYLGHNTGRKTLDYFLKKLKIKLTKSEFEKLFDLCKINDKSISIEDLGKLVAKSRSGI